MEFSNTLKEALYLISVDFTFEFIIRPSMAHSGLSVQERGKKGTARIEVPYFMPSPRTTGRRNKKDTNSFMFSTLP